MPNQLEKFYNRYSGVDSRTNKLLQDPGSFRKGTQNLRYDFEDNISNRQGLQRKDNLAPNFVDIFEYKYRDVNTGAAKVELLGVARDGFLYKKKNHFLKFLTFPANSNVSIFYDELADTFKCVVSGKAPVLISDTMTLTQLSTALNLLTGVSTVIVDDLGATVTSSLLAHTLNCVINDSTFALNPAFFWERVLTTGVTPFPTTLGFSESPDYEGISSANSQNASFITDGGFPMKYDSYSVYRVGMPRVLAPTGGGLTNLSGFAISSVTSPGGGLSLNRTYAYKFRFGFVNADGSETLGTSEINPATGQDYLIDTLSGTENAFTITIRGLRNGADFPVFAAVVNGNQNVPSAGGTINVLAGHNIVVGMCVRIPVRNDLLGQPGYSHLIAKVTAVTPTSITLARGLTSGLSAIIPNPTTLLGNGQPINAYFVQTQLENTITDVNSPPTSPNSVYHPPMPVGAFIRVYRTKEFTTVTAPGLFYEVIDLPLPPPGTIFSYTDTYDDDILLTTFNETDGNEIPRACKYIKEFQGILVQAGRPVNPAVGNDFYPSFSGTVRPVGSWGTGSPADNLFLYTEALLCDFQSVFWADALTPEGFPQDGLHEILVDTKFTDRVKGVATNKDALFIFKERSSALLSGSIATNDVQLEILEVDAGCVSHRSIQEVKGYVVWLDATNGFFACVAGRLPINIGYPIQDFQKINLEKLDFSKAVSANFRNQCLYICSVQGTTFVYDYADFGLNKRDCWYIWTGFTGVSLLVTAMEEFLVWDGIRTNQMKFTQTKYDFTDHKSAINFVLKTAWLSQGFPTVDKKYLKFWINSIQGDFSLTLKQYGNFLENVLGSQTNVQFPDQTSKTGIKQDVKCTLDKLSSVSFALENSQKNKWVRIQGYELQYSNDYDIGEPKR